MRVVPLLLCPTSDPVFRKKAADLATGLIFESSMGLPGPALIDTDINRGLPPPPTCSTLSDRPRRSKSGPNDATVAAALSSTTNGMPSAVSPGG